MIFAEFAEKEGGRSRQMLNAVPLFVAFFVFANHYARDTIAGLAKQLIDLNIVSANTYSALNSLFFLPNIISSLIISAFVSKIGIGKCIITALVIAATGIFYFIMESRYKMYIFFILGDSCMAQCMKLLICSHYHY